MVGSYFLNVRVFSFASFDPRSSGQARNKDRAGRALTWHFAKRTLSIRDFGDSDCISQHFFAEAAAINPLKRTTTSSRLRRTSQSLTRSGCDAISRSPRGRHCRSNVVRAFCTIRTPDKLCGSKFLPPGLDFSGSLQSARSPTIFWQWLSEFMTAWCVARSTTGQKV